MSTRFKFLSAACKGSVRVKETNNNKKLQTRISVWNHNYHLDHTQHKHKKFKEKLLSEKLTNSGRQQKSSEYTIHELTLCTAPKQGTCQNLYIDKAWLIKNWNLHHQCPDCNHCEPEQIIRFLNINLNTSHPTQELRLFKENVIVKLQLYRFNDV